MLINKLLHMFKGLICLLFIYFILPVSMILYLSVCSANDFIYEFCTNHTEVYTWTVTIHMLE